MTDPKPVRWFKTPRAKGGPARAALDVALEGRPLVGLEAITAAIARDAADLVDSARREQDPKLWLSAAARLLALTGQLDGRASAVGDDGAGGGAEPDDPDGLAAAVGAGPALGHVAES